VYGRWRLRLGISAVGSMVLLSIAALLTGLPAMLERAAGSYAGVAVFLVVIAGLHLGFDILGGYVLPKRAGRQHPDAGRFALTLARGVAVHTSVLVIVGLLMLSATQAVGRWGFVLAGVGVVFVMLAARPLLARAVAGVRVVDDASADGHRYATAGDEGFTGGVLGVVRARGSVLPDAWRETLPDRVLGAVARRRKYAVSSGAWVRGRFAAIGFVIFGLVVAAFAVPALMVGSSSGVIVFSLVFTLWSFGGLLVLPTLSRSASRSLDRLAVAEGVCADDLATAANMLDQLQDDEPQRSRWVERVFHPIPSVSAREGWMESGENHAVRVGAWDVARTSIFLSWAGLSLLSRSVHCNCGRPHLWVFLPTE
jgi:hypothetical protein